jgi:uncharacterized protein (TIGR03067 family)
MKRLLLAAVVAGLLVAADKDEAGSKGLDKLRGTWCRSGPQVAAVVPIDAGEGGTTYGLFIIWFNASKDITFKGDKLVVQTADRPVELTVRCDPTKTPKTLDATVGKGSRVFLGIYEVDGDTLRLCVGGPKERPKEFKNTRRTPLLELKRKKS